MVILAQENVIKFRIMHKSARYDIWSATEYECILYLCKCESAIMGLQFGLLPPIMPICDRPFERPAARLCILYERALGSIKYLVRCPVGSDPNVQLTQPSCIRRIGVVLH